MPVVIHLGVKQQQGKGTPHVRRRRRPPGSFTGSISRASETGGGL